MKIDGWAIGGLIGALAMLAAVPSWSQAYPNRPVKIVVPHAPGGAVDAVGRLLAQKLGDELGQRFVVENRAGASGNIGGEYVAHAPADGFTLLVNASIFVLHPFVFREVPFGPIKDFAAVSHIASGPLLFVTPPNSPTKTIKDFVGLATAQPGQMFFAT